MAKLSDREREVLALVAEGLTNAEMAERLVISPNTVEKHAAAAYRKLGLHNRAQATRYALGEGLVSTPDSDVREG